MISAKQTPPEYKTHGIKPHRAAGYRSLERPSSSSQHLRPSAVADPTSWIASAAIPWLCLLVAVWFLAFAFQLAVGSHTSDAVNLSAANATTGAASLIPNRSQTATSTIAAHDERADASTHEECDDMRKRLPSDVLVAMTMEDLKYLESTLCQSSSDPDHSPSGE
jgi:hypothetical protein